MNFEGRGDNGSEDKSDVHGCQRSPALVPGDVMGASTSWSPSAMLDLLG